MNVQWVHMDWRNWVIHGKYLMWYCCIIVLSAKGVTHIRTGDTTSVGLGQSSKSLSSQYSVVCIMRAQRTPSFATGQYPDGIALEDDASDVSNLLDEDTLPGTVVG